MKEPKAVDLYKAALAYRELNSCYKLGKQPPERLFVALEKASKVMDRMDEFLNSTPDDSKVENPKIIHRPKKLIEGSRKAADRHAIRSCKLCGINGYMTERNGKFSFMEMNDQQHRCPNYKKAKTYTAEEYQKLKEKEGKDDN